MSDEQFERFVREVARDHNSPPEVPREEMWTRIEAHRRARRASRARWGRGEGEGEGGERRFARPLMWAAGVAAVLAVGVGIGRLSVDSARSTVERPPVVAVRDDSAGEPDRAATRAEPSASAAREPIGVPTTGVVPTRRAADPSQLDASSLAYRVAAIQHLGRTEALFTSMRTAGDSAGLDAAVGPWARDLLVTTRMLLDSPAASDARIRRLLDDLELVLAQIAALPPAGGGGGSRADRAELEMIEQALEQRDVLTRLRTAIPAGPVRAGT